MSNTADDCPLDASSSARVLSKSRLSLPQPEARPDEPLVLSLWLLLIPARERPGASVQTLRTTSSPDFPSTTGPIFPFNFVTLTSDSIPAPATARSLEPSGYLPGHQEPHPPALPELPQPLRHLTRQFPLGGDRFRRHRVLSSESVHPGQLQYRRRLYLQVPYAFTLSLSVVGKDDRRTKKNRTVLDTIWRPEPRSLVTSCRTVFRDVLSLYMNRPELSPFVLNTDEKTEYKTALKALPSGGIW